MDTENATSTRVPHLRSGGRIPELDGLRGIAVATVMIYHFSIVRRVTTSEFDAVYYKINRPVQPINARFILTGR